MIRPWRRLVQGLGALLFFALPHLGWQGESLLRLDIPSWTLFVAGGRLRLEEFYLLGLFLLALLFFFLLLTMTLGRLWCGWFCPQTWLNNLVEGVARRLGMGVDPWKISGPWGRMLALHLFYAALALWCGATVVWYFVAPEVYWQRLAAGEPGPWSLGFTLGLAALIYLDAAFIRRLACRDFCPYGRFQAILLDRGTLTLGVSADHPRRCLDCRACVRACPMGIDIRRGYQVECINCGNCRDACRRVMARVQPGRPGLIRYRFGLEDAGWRALLSPRLLLVGLVLLALLGTLFFLAGQRQPVSLQVARLVTAQPAVGEDGMVSHRFRAQVANRTGEDAEYRLVARLVNGDQLSSGPATLVPSPHPDGPGVASPGPAAVAPSYPGEIPVLGQGADFFPLAPGERRRLLFAVTLPPAGQGETHHLTFALVDRRGRQQVKVNIAW